MSEVAELRDNLVGLDPLLLVYVQQQFSSDHTLRAAILRVLMLVRGLNLVYSAAIGTAPAPGNTTFASVTARTPTAGKPEPHGAISSCKDKAIA